MLPETAFVKVKDMYAVGISSSVRSGPAPASAIAAATSTLAGKRRAPSRAVPLISNSGAVSLNRSLPSLPSSTTCLAVASDFGGLRVTILTLSMRPRPAARIASRPTIAPVVRPAGELE